MALTLIVPLGAGGCGEGGSPSGRPDASRWLMVDARARQATIVLVASYDRSNSGYNIDGAVKGALRFTVPSGWRVTVRCVNNSTAYKYACELRKGAGSPVALPAGTSGLHPKPGLRSGEASTFSFLTAAPGNFRLLASTAGVEPVGMWVALGVIPGGQPTVRWLR